MHPGIYYITSKRLALKPFIDLTDYDLSVLGMLAQLNAPCHYSRFHGLLVKSGYSIDQRVFNDVLKRGIANGYITRSQIGCNVLYCITVEGKMLLHRFSEVLERIVADKVRKYGNGFDLE